MAHALHHWRYALNQTVLAWLAAEGYLTAAKIVERESLGQKKRQKMTNKTVDGMEDAGVMKMLYKQFKENLAAARDAKVCFGAEIAYFRDLSLTSNSLSGGRTDVDVEGQGFFLLSQFPCDRKFASILTARPTYSHTKVTFK